MLLDGLEQSSLADRFDRSIDSLFFRGESIQCKRILLGGLSLGAQLCIGVWDRQIRLLNSCVQEIAVTQLQPRHERLPETLLCRVSPSDSEERLVRLRTVKPDPLQH